MPLTSPGPISDLAAMPLRTKRSSRRLRVRWSVDAIWAVLFALPVILSFVYFSWGPIIQGLVFSFQKNNFVADSVWVGLDNFAYVLRDERLGRAVVNTLYFAGLAFVFGFPLPLLFAVFVAEVRRKRWLFSVLAYLPVIVPPVAGVLLWKVFFYRDESGLFNATLGLFGLGPIGWLNDPNLAMPSLVLFATWATAGGTAIIYLAALTGVRAELYEAAELDGASILARVWHVTLPQIRGVILILLLLQIIGTLQLFTEPFLFTSGGPNSATVTILLLVYEYAFESRDYGAASALSVLLAVALAIFSILYYIATRRWSTDQ